MKFGICIPNNWEVEDVRDVIETATRAERLGFDSVWVNEHIFNVTYVWDRITTKPYYEPLTILSYVAAVTTRVRLGTSVMVLPYHNPIRLAKTTATLNTMSGGRVDLGVGVGVIEPELEAMGSSLPDRGARADEAIAIMKELWTKDVPSYQRSFHSFPPMVFTPKPTRKPHISLLIGGSSLGIIRRTARVGDGWHASTQSPEDLAEKQWYLRERLATAGWEGDEFPYPSGWIWELLGQLGTSWARTATPWAPSRKRFCKVVPHSKSWAWSTWLFLPQRKTSELSENPWTCWPNLSFQS